MELITPLMVLAGVSGPGDACALLRPKEIAAVQGEAPEEIKPSARNDGALEISDCVFVLPTYSKSISLEVTRGKEDDALKRWKQIFHSTRSAEPGEGEGAGLPEPVRGLGDEAFWLPEKPSGALYVLRKKAFLRISIGGQDPREVKIKRARALVSKALRRL